MIGRIRQYFQESWSELKKVTWPTREHVRNLTILVFVISAAFGVYIGVIDLFWIRMLYGGTAFLGITVGSTMVEMPRPWSSSSRATAPSWPIRRADRR